MTKWIWYLGWSVVWMILPWMLIFVPLSNQFAEGGTISGAIRWLILMAGIVLLLYGFLVIRKLLLARDGSSDHRSVLGMAAKDAGMSEREAALVAEARQSAFGSQSAMQGVASGTVASSASPSSVASAPASLATPDLGRLSTGRDAAAGVMTAAGNPLVRQAFAQAMKEVDTKTYDSGLWAMALVECNGNEQAARITYMRARAADLAWSNAKAAVVVQPPKESP